MARRNPRMLPLGTPAPDFALPDTVSGKTVSLGDFGSSPALLVAFLCNHCPYVKHILEGFVAFARELGPRGLAVVAISSNDAASYPADAPPEMSRSRSSGASPSRTCTTSHRRRPTRTRRSARPTSFSSTAGGGSSIAGSSTTAVPGATSRSAVRICVRPLRRCCTARRFPTSRKRVSAAASSGSGGANLTGPEATRRQPERPPPRRGSHDLTRAYDLTRSLPVKSRLPIGAPFQRRMSYVVVA